MARIYCAGPLFNASERSEMGELARLLEREGHSTFLPQRDGLELSRLLPELRSQGMEPTAARSLLSRAIFSLDAYRLLSWADGAVANLNGRVPDEGTIVEASLAWRAGKALVLYKADARSLLEGDDNPMLLGLGDFRVVDDLRQVPKAMARALEEPRLSLERALALGEAISETPRDDSGALDLSVLVGLLTRFRPG